MAKQRAMAEASLREIGLATVNIDKVTKARLRRLAGDTPLCLKVRELVDMAEAAEGGGGVPLPGMETATSRNTLSSISQRLDAVVKYAVLGDMDKAIFKALGFPEHEERELTPQSIVRDIRRTSSRLSGLVDKLSKLEEGRQSKLALD